MPDDINQTVLELDDLMDRCLEDPTILVPADIDAIIAKQRKYRAQIEGGQKVKRASTKSTTSLDLTALGLLDAKEPVKRRM